MTGGGKTMKGNNPFAADAIISNDTDPICRLNLKETSEFVKSLPMSSSNNSINNSSQRRRSSVDVFGNSNSSSNLNLNLNSNSSSMVRKIDSPSTPGRPVFSFSSTVSRKNVPSKWDDAQKWLVNHSSHSSPAHNFIFGNNNNNNNSNNNSNHNNNVIKSNYYYEGPSPRSSISKPRLSCGDAIAAFNGVMVPADLPLKDKYADEIEPFTPSYIYSEPTKEAFLFKSHKLENEPMKDACTEMIPYKEEVHHRDFGTEMTPLGSSTTSRCHTPFKSNSPARHNTPASRSGLLALTAEPRSIDMGQLQECHFAKLQIGSTPFDSVTTNWSSREEEEEEISKSLRHFELGRRSVSVSESRACAWEEEEKTKSCLRYRREEAKIQAWINLQTAKAEAQSKKLEVKIQKMRSNLEEKLMKRMAMVQRKAEEWRETAQIEHSEQIRKATERTQQKLILFNQKNSLLSPHIVSSCGCFPCTTHHR